VEALARREALRERERRRPARVRPSEPVELLVEGRVLLRLAPAGLELVERRNQRLRDESAAVLAIRQLHRVPLPAPAKPALPLSRGSVEPTPRAPLPAPAKPALPLSRGSVEPTPRAPLPAPAKPALPLLRGSVEPTPRTSST